MRGKYPWGDTPDTGYANFKSFGILPVKSLKPNGYGMYDMIGNVWEWCSDWYDKDYYYGGQKKNPRGPATGTHKVLRGGAWYCAEDEIRVSNRYFALPDAKSFNVGFRCAQSVK
jgi:formylglycine-generating enzyme required for sulfatase activity